MQNNPLVRLAALGQSVWLDYIRRDLVAGGELRRLISEDALSGMTSNPTIFAQAIRSGALYDRDIREAPAETAPAELFERIAVADVSAAADAFRPVFERTGGLDGFVSIECRPSLAHDTEGTIEEARRLWRACDRPNVLIKIPGTKAGLPAIRACLVEGININITLLFSIDRYREVMEAYLSAMEQRAAAGRPLAPVASVASFFVSRVDTKVDQRLDQKLAAAGAAGRGRLTELKAAAGIANARLAYQAFLEQFQSARFERLRGAGARLQRPLWASTSTKNPALPDIYYIEALIADHSVNTMPLETLNAYRDHGDPKPRIGEDLAGAEAALRHLAEAGIDFAQVARELEDEGVRKFGDSYDELIDTIVAKRRALR